MQSLPWYYNRLKMMSISEIIWRFTSLASALLEHLRVKFGIVAQARYADSINETFTPPVRLTNVPVDLSQQANTTVQYWCEDLVKSADEVLDHKLTFFNLDKHDFGKPFQWNRDHFSHIDCPMDPILKVNYRDFANFGDCKLVWEPNRHHHLVILARAWRVSGDYKYAQGVVEQITSWINANPYGYGMNWRSPLELGVRLINWVWAYDLIHESGVITTDFQKIFFQSVYLHCRDVASKFSMGTSANNHLVGEAAGIFIASSYFNLFKESKEWQRESKAILEREILLQSYEDGCTREQALGYQFFVIQFYLFSGLVARKCDNDFSHTYWQRLNTMMKFIARIAEGGEMLPMFGDRDDGYVLDLGNAAADVNALMNWGYQLFDDEVYKKLISAPAQSGWWLFDDYQTTGTSNQSSEQQTSLQSIQFPQCGYSLLQFGKQSEGNQASLLIDCAELGYTSIAAHGHADALSFAMRLNGVDLFVDPGTYDYFTFPEWRNYFRKTCAHNTVEIDDEDQSTMLGPFLWGKHAISTCTLWKATEDGGIFTGSHNGYERLNQPLTHERSLELKGQQRQLVIRDTLHTQGSHKVKIYFHLSEFASIEQIEDNICTINLGQQKVRLEFDEALKLSSLNGSDNPKGGWLSRGYHQKVPIDTLIAETRIEQTREFACVVNW